MWWLFTYSPFDRMLDNVIIQEGDFTDDYFNKNEWWKDLPEVVGSGPAIQSSGSNTKAIDYEQALLQAEDESDAAAAIAARKELNMDENEFDENRQMMSETPSGPASPFTPSMSATPTRQTSVCNDTEAEAEEEEEDHDVVMEEAAPSDLPTSAPVQQEEEEQEDDGDGDDDDDDDYNMQLNVGHVDQYMLQFWEREMVGTNLGFGGFPDE